jgi:hypothetical protein
LRRSTPGLRCVGLRCAATSRRSRCQRRSPKRSSRSSTSDNSRKRTDLKSSTPKSTWWAMRTSENSVNRKSNFGELTFLELRRTRKNSQDLKPRLFHGCSLDWPELSRKKHRTPQEETPDSPGRNTGLPRKKHRTLQEETPDSPGRNTGLLRKKYRTPQEIRSTVFLQTTGFCERCSCAPVCVLLYCCSLTTEV